jgi:hypothetical protein
MAEAHLLLKGAILLRDFLVFTAYHRDNSLCKTVRTSQTDGLEGQETS